MCVGELSGASDAGRTRHGQGGICEAAHRKRREHAPFPDNQSAGGALQHGNVMKRALNKRERLFVKKYRNIYTYINVFKCCFVSSSTLETTYQQPNSPPPG